MSKNPDKITTVTLDETAFRRRTDAGSTAPNEFVRGFYCAVAALVQMHGDSTGARELVGLCDPNGADPHDLEVLREHGLLAR